MTKLELLPIVITARRGNWQRFLARKRNKRFLVAQDKIFLRDDNTCRYCGFKADDYQVVVNHDHNYSNNKANNLMTACIFCAQCFFIDQIGKNNGAGGYIIYLPEISQADLNHICRTLFTGLLQDAPYKGALQNAYLSLKDRNNAVEEIFGEGSSAPNTFGQSLIDNNLQQKQSSILSKLRLLPEKAFFSKEILYWKNTNFAEVPI